MTEDIQEHEVQEEAVAEAPPADPPIEAEQQAEPDPYEADARAYGWKPKEEWTGPEGGWVDAEKFVQRTLPSYAKGLEQKLSDANERLQRMERVTNTALERQKALHQAEIERLKTQERQARDELDFDAYDSIQKRRQELEQASAPEPKQAQQPEELNAWVSANPWFNADPGLRQIAQAAAARAAQSGGDLKAEIAAAEAAVRAVAPDAIKTAKPEPKPEPRPVTVETASNAARLIGAKRTLASQLPAEDRANGERFVKEGLFPSIEAYAKEYFNG